MQKIPIGSTSWDFLLE